MSSRSRSVATCKRYITLILIIYIYIIMSMPRSKEHQSVLQVGTVEVTCFPCSFKNLFPHCKVTPSSNGGLPCVGDKNEDKSCNTLHGSHWDQLTSTPPCYMAVGQILAPTACSLTGTVVLTHSHTTLLNRLLTFNSSWNAAETLPICFSKLDSTFAQGKPVQLTVNGMSSLEMHDIYTKSMSCNDQELIS